MKRIMSLPVLSALAIMGGLQACKHDPTLTTNCTIPDTVSYANFVAPLMALSCNGCHSSSSPADGVATDTYLGVQNIASNGRLYGSVAHLSGYEKMPQGANRLPECDIERLKKWIDAGAPNN